MKQLLITIAAVVLVATGLAGPIHDAVMNGNIDEVSPVTWTADQFSKFARLKFSK